MTNPAAQLAAMRRQVTKSCPVCGNAFTGLKKRVYCGETCKTRAKRARSNK